MWTYDPSDLNNTTEEGRKNIVRLLVGDTDQSDPQLEDEEILFALGDNNNRLYSAAVMCVNLILSKYSRLVTIELDEAIKENYSDLIANFKELRKELTNKSRFSTGGIRISATGLTTMDFEKARQDPNRVVPGIEQEKWRKTNYDIQNEGYLSVTN